MEVMDAIRQRRAVRSYTPEAVDERTVRRLIEAATWAPSATNEQPWLFAVVTKPETLERISVEAKAHAHKTQGPNMPGRLARQLSDPTFNILHGAPALIVIATEQPTYWALEDCALAAENLMLAARSEGLGTCWVGLAQEWLGTPDGKALLGLPKNCIPVAPIIVGHPKEVPATVPRREPQIRWLT
jgi:nitroreductase